MKLAKTKSKRTSAKKSHNVLTGKGLQKLREHHLKEKMVKSKQSIFILFDNEKYEIPAGKERMQFLNALFKAADPGTLNEEENILTTQEVADLLNVSRPYVIKLIKDRKLKSFKVGSHRRINEVDALEFRKKMRNEQEKALDQLAEETENLGLEFK